MREGFVSITGLTWSGCFLFLLFFFREGWRSASPGLSSFGRERRALKSVVAALHELQEIFEAGLVPDPSKWESLAALPAPWGALSAQSLGELRARGAALLPTLRRLRDLAEKHAAALAQARARSGQALAQALACGAMVPLFGGVLYLLLPGVDSRPWLWSLLCFLALLSAGAGALWLLFLADQARWGGLQGAERAWVISAQCAGERLLSLIRSGQPPDLAWGEATRFLAQDAPSLARSWGFQIYEAPDASSGIRRDDRSASGCRGALIECGVSIRRAIQVSLMEGRPCAERIESVLAALRLQITAGMERELSLLGTRALTPLFVCVAPALFGLLGAGLFLTWRASLS